MIRAIQLLILCSLISCSSISKKTPPVFSDKRVKSYFRLSDKSGSFRVIKDSKYNSKKQELIVRHTIVDPKDTSKKPLEKNISISTYGILGKKVPVLRPKISQYFVWFDGKRFATEMKINTNTKSLDIKLRSPEPQWNGDKSVPFPKGSGVYCFFSQIEECIGITGFVKKAVKHKAGKMNFHVVWDGYPYFMDQYIGISPKVFAEAQFSFDGKKDDLFRFSLDVDGQLLFYIYDKKLKLKKILWVSQGYTKERVQ